MILLMRTNKSQHPIINCFELKEPDFFSIIKIFSFHLIVKFVKFINFQMELFSLKKSAFLKFKFGITPAGRFFLQRFSL